MSTPKIVELPADTTVTAPTGPAKAKGGRGSEKGKAKETASPSWSRFLFKWTLFTILFAFGAAHFIAGDLLWGYRGKYVKKQTYFPVSGQRVRRASVCVP